MQALQRSDGAASTNAPLPPTDPEQNPFNRSDSTTHAMRSSDATTHAYSVELSQHGNLKRLSISDSPSSAWPSGAGELSEGQSSPSNSFSGLFSSPQTDTRSFGLEGSAISQVSRVESPGEWDGRRSLGFAPHQRSPWHELHLPQRPVATASTHPAMQWSSQHEPESQPMTSVTSTKPNTPMLHDSTCMPMLDHSVMDSSPRYIPAVPPPPGHSLAPHIYLQDGYPTHQSGETTSTVLAAPHWQHAPVNSGAYHSDRFPDQSRILTSVENIHPSGSTEFATGISTRGSATHNRRNDHISEHQPNTPQGSEGIRNTDASQQFSFCEPSQFELLQRNERGMASSLMGSSNMNNDSNSVLMLFAGQKSNDVQPPAGFIAEQNLADHDFQQKRKDDAVSLQVVQQKLGGFDAVWLHCLKPGRQACQFIQICFAVLYSYSQDQSL